MASPLFVSRFGRGAPLLCLHGIEAHGIRYMGLASHLEGYEVVAPDLRGHGRSPRIGPFSIEQHVQDVLPILAELGPRTTVLGHSFGGRIAWEMARAAPSALARLILVDPALHVTAEFAHQRLDASPIYLRWPDRTAAFTALAAGRQRSALWSVALDVAVGLEETSAGQLRVAVADEAVIACWNRLPDAVSESTFRGPTLAVEAGQENGAFLTPTALASLRRQLGNRLQYEVLDSAHAITADAPEHLAALVRRFIAG